MWGAPCRVSVEDRWITAVLSKAGYPPRPLCMRSVPRPYTLDARSGREQRDRSMTRLSEYLLPTEKQPPTDAEAISHKLMVRAGLIRQMGAGMWSWLPAGWRVAEGGVGIGPRGEGGECG